MKQAFFHSRRSFNRSGFTIIELIMGSIILAMIGTLCYAALTATFKTQKTLSARSDIQELGTALVNKIKIDLSQTFHVESRTPLTRFKGEDLGDLDRISFTALVHIPTQIEARESDQALVTYQTIPNPDNGELNILQRRETAVIAPKDDAELSDADFVDVSDNIISFNLEYFDGEKYIPTWDLESAAQRNKLPALIKIKLELMDERKVKHTFFNTFDIPMWQNIGLQPKAKTTPNPNASPTPNAGGSIK